MNYDIRLGKYKVTHLLSCEVRKDANKLTDTATIKLSGMAYSKALEVENKIKRGDKVVIKLGYNDELPTEFNGYISNIATDNTIVIECEDGMFLFKAEVKNKQYKKVEATEIVEDVAKQIGGFTVVKGAGTASVKFDKFTINDATAYEVFKKIKSETRLHIFVKDKELHIHLQHTYKGGNVAFDFSKNIESSSLKYVKEEDKKVQINVIGMTRNNNKTNVLIGEPGGDKLTIHRYNISDKNSLKAIGKEEIKKHRYTGYEGDITGWLLPYCTYSYSAKVIDTDYDKRQGTYYIEAVTTTMNVAGGKRKITLGKLLK